MKQTIYPDSRGRAFLLTFLKKIGWKEGDAVEVDFIKVVECCAVDVKCDFCDADDIGTKEQLEDRGWNKIFFDDIELPSITSCFKHRLQAVKKAEDLQRRQ